MSFLGIGVVLFVFFWVSKVIYEWDFFLGWECFVFSKREMGIRVGFFVF